MTSFFSEFKKFALKGSIMDLAIAVVIGTAFNNIINSLVTNIITPPLGLLLGRIDFQNLAVNLGGTVTIKYGLFLQAVVTFLLVALSLFVIIRLLAHLERLARKDPPAEPPPPSMKSPELVVLEEIRDRLAPGAADSHP